MGKTELLIILYMWLWGTQECTLHDVFILDRHCLDSRWPIGWHVGREPDRSTLVYLRLPAGSSTLPLVYPSSPMQEYQLVTRDWIIHDGPACPHLFVNINKLNVVLS